MFDTTCPLISLQNYYLGLLSLCSSVSSIVILNWCITQCRSVDFMAETYFCFISNCVKSPRMSLINTRVGGILILLFRYFTWKVQIFIRSFKGKLKCFLKKLIEEWTQSWRKTLKTIYLAFLKLQNTVFWKLYYWSGLHWNAVQSLI